MPKEIQEKFSVFHKLMSDAVFEKKMNHEMKETKPERDFEKRLRTEGDGLREALESSIHARLWNAKA